jgi:hypothetical protein
VRLRGLEPPRADARRPLRPVCLPVPPQPHESRRRRGAGQWSMPGSNRRPPACKAGALPSELMPQNPGGGNRTPCARRRLSYGQLEPHGSIAGMRAVGVRARWPGPLSCGLFGAVVYVRFHSYRLLSPLTRHGMRGTRESYAPGVGIEPTSGGLEAPVLPLDDPGMSPDTKKGHPFGCPFRDQVFVLSPHHLERAAPCVGSWMALERASDHSAMQRFPLNGALKACTNTDDITFLSYARPVTGSDVPRSGLRSYAR